MPSNTYLQFNKVIDRLEYPTLWYIGTETNITKFLLKNTAKTALYDLWGAITLITFIQTYSHAHANLILYDIYVKLHRYCPAPYYCNVEKKKYTFSEIGSKIALHKIAT